MVAWIAERRLGPLAMVEGAVAMDAEIIVVPDAETLAHEAARLVAQLAREAAEFRGRFSVALSGGSTPGGLYRLLAEEPYRAQVPWEEVHLFWGDERCVPPDDPGSNYHLAREMLIARVPIPAENVHRVRGELGAQVAAQGYEQTLEGFFCGPRPRFDLVLLGLGEDGHTASLFPGSSLLAETERLVAPARALYQDRPAERVTLTLPAINAARQVLFLVAGSDKAKIVQAVVEGPAGQLPAQHIRPTAGQLTCLLDASAASLLSDPHGGR
jgi:6-phosphogluconolactonase